MTQSEPRNPFYLPLLIVSLLFVLTALGTAVMPVLEDKAAEAGSPPPPSEFRDRLRTEGWLWLLYLVSAMAVLGILCMGLDRLRRLQKDRAAGTIPPNPPGPPP
ncbi:MAG: hypothetical protein K2R98_18665 [Gemmataceae bacterium]|nr:hypothetical protein [Gemmataceae bacterium]